MNTNTPKLTESDLDTQIAFKTSCQCSQGGECDCGLYGDPQTTADHVINIICAIVMLWVLWEATKGFV